MFIAAVVCYCNLSHICSRPYDAYMHDVVLAVVAVVEGGVIATYKIVLPCGDFFYFSLYGASGKSPVAYDSKDPKVKKNTTLRQQQNNNSK